MLKSSSPGLQFNRRRATLFKAVLLCSALAVIAGGCGVRFDMQDQPRYKAYKQSDFFADGRASRDLPPGTVARGLLKENKAFYTGKIDNPDPNVQAQTTTDAMGNTVITSFPNAITEFPLPVTRELVDRGEERYNIYCGVCHGPVGAGDGMIVRRGFVQPPTYHDDRLRNAPVGHFFDVITNGWGRMNGYAADIPAYDRWAIVAYIRALQVSQDPDVVLKMNSGDKPAAPGSPAGNGPDNTATPEGGAKQ
ncbi:MAG TPA: cytochrome c [Pyrinomonadaceae bacterium]|nr:cytochrome c [Pyrinomonadaceae bacterium]HMP65087.1 cytochrome c [Pyrinomonadaceae bacterium]